MGQPAYQPLPAETPPYVSAEDYLLFEREALNKHEYYFGEVQAMAGARPPHNRISFNLNTILGGQLEGKSCTGYTSDQRVQVMSGKSYVYPDMTVVCGEAKYNDENAPENLLNPTLIVEVLSDSTRNKDRGEKFMLYRQIPSLRQYLMLDSAAVHAELYTRQSNDHWLFMEIRDPDAVLDLGSVGCELSLARLYHGVTLGS